MIDGFIHSLIHSLTQRVRLAWVPHICSGARQESGQQREGLDWSRLKAEVWLVSRPESDQKRLSLYAVSPAMQRS